MTNLNSEQVKEKIAKLQADLDIALERESRFKEDSYYPVGAVIRTTEELPNKHTRYRFYVKRAEDAWFESGYTVMKFKNLVIKNLMHADFVETMEPAERL